jgi:hypothetical protein
MEKHLTKKVFGKVQSASRGSSTKYETSVLYYILMGLFVLVFYGILYLFIWLMCTFINWILSILDINFLIDAVQVFSYALIILSLLFLFSLREDLLSTPKRKSQSKAMRYEEDCMWLDSYTDYYEE